MLLTNSEPDRLPPRRETIQYISLKYPLLHRALLNAGPGDYNVSEDMVTYGDFDKNRSPYSCRHSEGFCESALLIVFMSLHSLVSTTNQVSVDYLASQPSVCELYVKDSSFTHTTIAPLPLLPKLKFLILDKFDIYRQYGEWFDPRTIYGNSIFSLEKLVVLKRTWNAQLKGRLLQQSLSLKAMIWHDYVLLLIVGYDAEDKPHDYSIYDIRNSSRIIAQLGIQIRPSSFLEVAAQPSLILEQLSAGHGKTLEHLALLIHGQSRPDRMGLVIEKKYMIMHFKDFSQLKYLECDQDF
jgi:hypothetical protein